MWLLHYEVVYCAAMLSWLGNGIQCWMELYGSVRCKHSWCITCGWKTHYSVVLKYVRCHCVISTSHSNSWWENILNSDTMFHEAANKINVFSPKTSILVFQWPNHLLLCSRVSRTGAHLMHHSISGTTQAACTHPLSSTVSESVSMSEVH
jgi:hypothetical protein